MTKFYLSLTDQDGKVIDRFRLEMSEGENPADEVVGEDSEGVGDRFSDADLVTRLYRMMRQTLKNP